MAKSDCAAGTSQGVKGKNMGEGKIRECFALLALHKFWHRVKSLNIILKMFEDTKSGLHLKRQVEGQVYKCSEIIYYCVQTS